MVSVLMFVVWIFCIQNVAAFVIGIIKIVSGYTGKDKMEVKGGMIISTSAIVCVGIYIMCLLGLYGVL